MERAELRVEQIPFVFAHPKTRQFLLSAKEEGALGCPPGPAESIRSWERGLQFVNSFFNEDITLEELGKRAGLSAKNKKERPRQIIKAFIKKAYNRCSPELRQRFPLAEIPIRKPLSDRSKDKISAAEGGLMLRIRQQIRDGAGDVKTIAQGTDASTMGVRQALSRLANRGERIPEIPESSIKKQKKLLEKAREARTYAETSKVLAQCPNHTGFFTKHRDIFVSLMDVIRQSGFRIRGQDTRHFLSILEDKRIPFKSFDNLIRGEKVGSSHYVMKQEVGAISETFRLSRRLAQFKELKTLRQVTDLKVDLPNTTKVEKREGFRSFVLELKRMGVDKNQVLRNSPVPIFAYHPRVARGRVYWTNLVSDSDFATLIEFAKEIKENKVT